MKKLLFLAPLAMLTACSDSEMVDQTTTPSDGAVKVYLTDQQGNPVEQVDGNFGIYNLHIEGAEAWVINTSDAGVTPTLTQGRGDAVIPVHVATCWGIDRHAQLTVKTLDLDAPATRAGEGVVETTNVGVSQAPAVSASQIMRFGSNVGVGYAVDPNRSTDILMAMGQPIFDIYELYNDGTLMDNYQYEQTEEYYLEDSEAKLHEKIDIAGGLSFKFGSVAATGTGGYDHVYDTNTSSWHCMMVNRTKFYQREFNYLDEIHSDEPSFSNGFNFAKNKLEEELKAATNKEMVATAVSAFFDHYGPFFVYRALLGAELDYTGTIHKSVTSDSTLIKAAIKVKWEKEVVEPKKSDSGSSSGGSGSGSGSGSSDDDHSADAHPDDDPTQAVERFFAENGQDSKDKDSVDLSGEGEYEKYMSTLTSSTSATLVIKGGNGSISILGSGGKISSDQLSEWQHNINSSNSVMVNFSVAPIYIVFPGDSKAYKYLKQYDENGKIVEF